MKVTIEIDDSDYAKLIEHEAAGGCRKGFGKMLVGVEKLEGFNSRELQEEAERVELKKLHRLQDRLQGRMMERGGQ